MVLDKQTYDEKMSVMLEDRSTYKKLTEDPTSCLQRKMNQQLLNLKWGRDLPEKCYDRLRCSSGVIPQICALPKLHKAEVPLRHVVSSDVTYL